MASELHAMSLPLNTYPLSGCKEPLRLTTNRWDLPWLADTSEGGDPRIDRHSANDRGLVSLYAGFNVWPSVIIIHEAFIDLQNCCWILIVAADAGCED